MKIYQQILNVDTIPNWSRKQNSKNIFEEIINLVLGITKHGKHPKHKPSAKGWGAGKILLLRIIKIFFPNGSGSCSYIRSSSDSDYWSNIVFTHKLIMYK